MAQNDIDHIIAQKLRREPGHTNRPEHAHSYHEIFYVLSGECRVLVNEHIHQMHHGDLVVITPGDLHIAKYETGNCEAVLIFFKLEFLRFNDMQTFIQQDAKNITHSTFGTVPKLYQSEFENILMRMVTECSNIDNYSPSFINCYMHELILNLFRHSVVITNEEDRIASGDADILKATRHIYQNYKKPLSLEEVSAVVALSPTYFSKKFKSVTGMGFKEYLNYVRLTHARTALLTTNNTITDIALESGFNDSNYFKDLFKKVYGSSPREYRRNRSNKS